MKCLLTGVVLMVALSCFAKDAAAADGVAVAPEPKPVEQSAGVLREYLAREDASYEWHKVREGELAGAKYVELILISQSWRDIAWKHRLFIVLPKNATAAKNALLLIAGGNWKEKYADPAYNEEPPREAAFLATLAQQLKSPLAVLLNVPQQPIFDGKVEDQIISYTFEQFLDTGDSEWPLLLPMVKSAVKGMDAVQEFCEAEWSMTIDSFTVTGASKRGWTTWLTGATDSRVSAIAPMVIDMLNMAPQMEHQKKSWGELSEQIRDYTERNILQRLKTEAGKALLNIVDPIAYRETLKHPKLIILGTNDPYWTVDALNLYWDQLLGAKHILYVPNNVHGLKDYLRILGGLSALHIQAQGGQELPQLSWSFDESDDVMTLSIASDIAPVRCQVWSAQSDTRDFRASVWTASAATPSDEGYTIRVSKPEEGFVAFFGEVVYERAYWPLHLSTNVRILLPIAKAAP